VSVSTLADFKQALQAARRSEKTTVIAVQADREARVPGYDSWWDVAVAETSALESVRQARREYEESLKKERYFL